MNIEKIKNYNQKMLALISTLGVIFLLILIIMLIPEFLRILPDRSYNDNPSGLISGEKAENLNQENLRKQIISYESPWLIDTLKSEYIIPVSIKTLKKPEEIEQTANSETLDLMDAYSSTKRGKGYYNRRYFEGSYANLILYKPFENKTKPLFKERILIGDIQAYYFKDDILLVFYSAEKDTDKNGIIDLNDNLNLCIYSLDTETIRKITGNDNSIEEYKFIENSKDLLIEFKLGQYQNNQFDNYQSPRKIMKYEFDTQMLSEIVPAEIQNEMQKLVEGK